VLIGSFRYCAVTASLSEQGGASTWSRHAAGLMGTRLAAPEARHTFVLKPEVADKRLQRPSSITGCTLWRQSQFGSKHSHVSTPRRQT
jgi:hypothetical protein